MYALAGNLVLSDATYAEGIGFFDKVAINYGYRIFTDLDENPLLERLIDDAEDEGYVFLTDQVRNTGNEEYGGGWGRGVGCLGRAFQSPCIHPLILDFVG